MALEWSEWPRPAQKLWQELKKKGIIVPGPVSYNELLKIEDWIMAITKQVTKVSVKESSGNKQVVLNVDVLDNGTSYASKNFTLDYNKNDDIEVMVKKLQSKMQKFIDVTVEDITYFNHAKLDAAVTYLNSNMTP